jgi:hypothetical protein
VAERERLPNKERRNQARDERKRREAQAAAKQKKSGLRTALIAAGVLVVVGAVLAQAFLGGPASIDDAILISSSDADAARQAAGCELLVDREPLEDRSHFEAASAPSADSLYGGGIRPTHSGPHMLQFHPIVSAGSSSQIDERSTTHNLEHGSIIAWYDPEQIDEANAMGSWSETLNANGFASSNSGAAVMVSPYTDPGISSGKAVAFRAWGVAMDCDEWDETVANSFVIDHYGTHGIAPERTLGPYPDGVLAYDDVEVDDNTEAPIDGQLMPEGEGEGEDTSGTDAEDVEDAEDE